MNLLIPIMQSLMPDVIKPVFFIGMDRSGLSIIFDPFMQCHDLAFFSQD